MDALKPANTSYSCDELQSRISTSSKVSALKQSPISSEKTFPLVGLQETSDAQIVNPRNQYVIFRRMGIDLRLHEKGKLFTSTG